MNLTSKFSKTSVQKRPCNCTHIWKSVSAKLCVLVTFTASRAYGQGFNNARLISKENDRHRAMSDRKLKQMDRKRWLWCTLRHKQQPSLFVKLDDLLRWADLQCKAERKVRVALPVKNTGLIRNELARETAPWERVCFPVLNKITNCLMPNSPNTINTEESVLEYNYTWLQHYLIIIIVVIAAGQRLHGVCLLSRLFT